MKRMTSSLRTVSVLATFLLVMVQNAWADTTWTEVNSEATLNSAITDGAHILMTGDITLSEYIKIGQNSNQTVTINLNGHTLKRTGLMGPETNGHVIEVWGRGNLTIEGGTLSGGYANNGGGICNYGTVTINNVTITGCRVNTTDGRGGAIYNGDGAKLTINGGVITGNSAHNGGGIFNDETSVGATISNCTISNNTANGSGGGIFNDNANSDGSGTAATLTMTDCTVTGNSCTGNGGGIRNIGILTIDGATITGNTVGEDSSDGAGIYQRGPKLNMQGAVTIGSNTKNSNLPSNLYLSSGHIITVTGSLADSSIGLSMTGNAGTATSGLSGNGDLSCFTNDYPDAANLSLVDGEATLTVRTDQVYYIYRSWNDQLVSETRTVSDYIELTGNDASRELALQGGRFYVVKGADVRYERLIAPLGDPAANIILCDGAKLTAQITIDRENGMNHKLNIFAQMSETGKLVANGIEINGSHTSYYTAAIGSGESEAMGILTIHGGVITATGIVHSAGIGGGGSESIDYYLHGGHGGEVTIYGGTITATGGQDAAGIGGGDAIADDMTSGNYGGCGGTTIVYGGTITARGDGDGAGIGSGKQGVDERFKIETSGTFKIYGGQVSATGGYGSAGIGGGLNSNGGEFYAYGGKVYAYGDGDAAGIGSGEQLNGDKNGGYVEVNGGYVEAHGSDYAAGIGGGQDASGATVIVNDGKVYAYGGSDAAGIGSGELYKAEALHGGSLTVNGGYVFADGTDVGCGIGGGQDAKGAKVFIYGGTVEAWSGDGSNTCAIGSNLSGTENQGTLTIGDKMMVHAGDNPSSSSLFTSDQRVPACWYRRYAKIEVCTHPGATYTIDGTDVHGTHTVHCSYCTYELPEEHHFENGKCTVCGAGLTIILADNADNTETLRLNDDMMANSVTLSGRTLYKDGTWNTLCLPFALEGFTGTPLEGATVKALSESSFAANTGTMTLNFVSVEAVETGKPYIVKWESGENIESPVFNNVTISNQLNNVETDAVTFCGVFNPFILEANDKTKLYLGSNNTLYYPNAEMTIGAFRAYFQLTDGITAGNPISGTLDVKAFVLSFDDEQSTGIIGAALNDNEEMINDKWYTLDGRKLAGKPTRKGVYINNGSKVVIK